ncbi:UNVERIFIED_CONTAM: hypothetical protein RMT77_006269 [Armadillidium vulgare]
MRALKLIACASMFIFSLYTVIRIFNVKKPFNHSNSPNENFSHLFPRRNLTSKFLDYNSKNTNLNKNRSTKITIEAEEKQKKFTFISLQKEETFNYENSIFFIEGFSNSNFKPRFLCSIESAALVHPNISVSVMMTSPKLHVTKYVKKLLIKYNNIRFIFLNATKLYLNSPLKEWFLKEMWKGTKYPDINYCDPIRYLILWKYGGIYLDLDVISLRNLKEEEENFLGIEYPVVNSAVMGFRKKHSFLEECMEKISKTFAKDKWGVYGPSLNTEVLTKRCGLSLPSSKLPFCPDIKLYKEKAFYSLRGKVARKYAIVNENLSKSIVNDQEILAFHFYNHISQKFDLPLKRLSPIGEITRKFCPVIAEEANFVFEKEIDK